MSAALPTDAAGFSAWMKAERLKRDWSTTKLATIARGIARREGSGIALTQQTISGFEQPGTAKRIPDWMRFVRKAFDQSDPVEPAQESLPPIAQVEEPLATVGIQHIDMAFGLGATFTDTPPEFEVLQFPTAWVQTITWSPPELLTWTRGRGDSMLPTIDDGDLILLDRSQRDVKEQDALWAFTVGDTASIKRLRKKGDRMQILSDNPSVPSDEEPIDLVNIVARVIFVGKRK